MDFDLTGPFVPAALRFLGVIVVSSASGCAITMGLRGPYFAGERLLIGASLGVVLLTALCYVLSFLFGFHTVVVSIALALQLGFALWVILRSRKRRSGIRFFPLHPGRKRIGSNVDIPGMVVFLVSLLFFWLFGTMYITWRNGTLSTGIIDNYGDLPFHLGTITGLVNGGTIPPQNHTLAGHALGYPLFSDFFSAMLILLEIPLEHAMELPCILLNSVAMTLLYYIGYRFVRHKVAAVIAPALFVLAGGLGFLWFLSDVYLANTPVWEVLTHLPRRYTNLGEHGIHWINPTLAHLIPQRAFLFGFPLALSLTICWWTESDKARGNAWLPGLLAGLLPLSHTHAFLALMIAGGGLALVSLARPGNRRNALRFWGTFFSITAVIALPQVLYLLSTRISLGGFIRFETGWMAGEENLVWYWLKNTGVILPLLLGGLLFRRPLGILNRTVWFYLPFGLLLIAGNLFLFAPLPYDTNKILVFGFLLGMPFVARALVGLYRVKSWWVRGLLFRTLLLSLVLSGSLNLIHELQGGGWDEITPEEIELARMVGSSTTSQSIFLTAPVHNSFLTLAGRGVVLGYPGHVVSHGLDHRAAEEAVEEIYSGGSDAAKKIEDFSVDYIVVGPQERSKYGDAVKWIGESFPGAFRTRNYVVYRCL